MLSGVQQLQVQGGHSSIISMQLCQLRSVLVKNGGAGGPWWPELGLVAVVVRAVGLPGVVLFTRPGARNILEPGLACECSGAEGCGQ